MTFTVGILLPRFIPVYISSKEKDINSDEYVTPFVVN